MKSADHLEERVQLLTVAPQLLREREAAKILACSVAALRRWRREGRGPRFVHVERCVRYTLSDITAFVENSSSTKKKAADLRSAAELEGHDGRATTQP